MPVVRGPGPGETRVLRGFISGPSPAGDHVAHTREAVQTGLRLMAHGYAPYIPHLSLFAHYLEPQSYTEWMNVAFAWIHASDAVLRLTGHSPGADQEVGLAMQLGIPVFTSEEDLYAFYQPA